MKLHENVAYTMSNKYYFMATNVFCNSIYYAILF